MRVLVVEDNIALCDGIRNALTNWAFTVRKNGVVSEVCASDIMLASTVAEACEHLARVSGDHVGTRDRVLAIIDVRLQDESGFDVVKYAMQSTKPPIVLAISGLATAREAFLLSDMGVRGYLAKPFEASELRGSIEAVLNEPTGLEKCVMAEVGHRALNIVQEDVQLAMLKRALEIEEGNIAQAANLLKISRGAFQQMMDRFGLRRPGKK